MLKILRVKALFFKTNPLKGDLPEMELPFCSKGTGSGPPLEAIYFWLSKDLDSRSPSRQDGAEMANPATSRPNIPKGLDLIPSHYTSEKEPVIP